VPAVDGDHRLGLRDLHSVERRPVGDPGLCNFESGDGGRRLGSARHPGDERRRSYGQPDLAILVRNHRRNRARGFQKLLRLRAAVRGDLVRDRRRGVYVRAVFATGGAQNPKPTTHYLLIYPRDRACPTWLVIPYAQLISDLRTRISATNEHEYSRIVARGRKTNEPSR